MIPRVMLRDRVTVNYRTETGPVTPYGDPTMEEALTVEDVPAMVWPSGIPDELLVGRDTRISIYNVILAPNVTIDGLSSIEWNGITMEVMGEPQMFMARGKEHHYEIKMRDIRG